MGNTAARSMSSGAPAEGCPAEGEVPAKGRVKVQRLLDIQKEVQARYAEVKLGEADPDHSKPKYMITFPFPYMNGKLHLGHAFSFTKAEFAARFKRMKGFNVLFPFGFHCTGMPISAAADRLKREIKVYGNPPIFPHPPAEPEVVEKVAAVPGKFKGKKTKAAQKSGGSKSQWEILRMLGISDEDIPEFQNAEHWLGYFPPPAKVDLQNFGSHIDWRRSFITTEKNPYYDSFIRWQFTTLKGMEDKLVFGNRPSVFSTVEQQQCADHDRSQGEGVGPQEYTIIKIEVMELTGKLESLKGKKVFLAAATLRPETMYGQTNCWVLPWGEYGVFETEIADELIVTAERGALNMSYQGHSAERGTPVKVLTITGQDLIGVALKAPLCPLEKTYCLPLLTIKMDKGTGVVTSVPSDSPADYIAMQDLKKKAPLREKYNVKDEWVLPFECIDIIDTPSMGSRAAEFAVEEFKIQSQNDVDKLEKAKEKVYKEGFYSGIMNSNCGKHSGMKVEDAKELVKGEMIESGDAFLYWEPENKVISRSGKECVVALTDQWSLRYGEEKWRAQIEDHIENTYETYMPDTKNKFRAEAKRLTEWGCSRAYGLGTKMPFDDRFVIESLSDSTIYMAYYTVAHFLQSGPFDGSEQGSGKIAPEQMTHEVWDYVLKGADMPTTDINEDTLKAMRAEFEYWYKDGYDLRCSGKDLIGNHLTFQLYNHAAIFPDRMPRSCFTNGHVLMDNKKMSKSEGNFLTLEEAIVEYSSDATRLTMANSGDSNEFANFETSVANAAVLELFKLQEKATELCADENLRSGEMNWHDKMFMGDIENAANVTATHFEGMRFREGLKTGFYEFINTQAQYKLLTAADGMHKDVVTKYLSTQAIVLCPLCPHVAEELWRLSGNEGLCADAAWPAESNEFNEFHRASVFLTKFLKTLREGHDKLKKGKKPVATTKVMVYVKDSFSEIQEFCLAFLKAQYDANDGQIPPSFKGELTKLLTGEKGMDKKAAGMALGFAAFTATACGQQGPAVLETAMPYNQTEVLQATAAFIQSSMGLTLEVYDATTECPDPKKKKSGANPGVPSLHIE